MSLLLRNFHGISLKSFRELERKLLKHTLAMGGKQRSLLYALRAPPPFADPSNIKTIISANYPENFLKFHSYVLTALEIRAKSDIEL